MSNHDPYVQIQYSGFLILINLFLVGLKHGFVSIQMVLTFILFSVLVVPLISNSILGTPLFSYQNLAHQTNEIVISKTSVLSSIASIIFSFILLFSRKNEINLLRPKETYRLGIPAIILCVIYLFFSYLAEPGGTILTTSYANLREERSGFSNLAGNMMMVFWAWFYVACRNNNGLNRSNLLKLLFYGASILGILWLLLHARRSELIGFFLVLLFNSKYLKGKISLLKIGVGLFFVFSLYVVGLVRDSGNITSEVVSESVLAQEGTKEAQGTSDDISNMPSGLGNIMATFTSSIYYIHVDKKEYLNGKTVFNYPIKLLPSNLTSILGMPKPVFIHDIVFKNYSYNGGMYILAPAYVNFGIIGFIIGTIVLAFFVIICAEWFYSINNLKAVISIIMMLYFIKLVWYGPVPFLKGAYFSLLFFVFVLMFKTPLRFNER